MLFLSHAIVMVEGTSFNALEAQTLVGDTFVDVSALIIDDLPLTRRREHLSMTILEMVSY